MKKWIVIFAISLIGLNSFGQPGFKAGATFSTITGEDADDVKMLVGFYAGVLYNLMVSDMFSVQPELVFAGQGAGFEDSDNARLRLNYLNLVALLRYNTQSGFFFGTGPQFGFLMSAKVKDDNTSADFKEFVKSFDFAWAFALGYQFASGFGIDARYNLGLANIADGGGTIKNSVIQLGLFYMLSQRK